LNNAPLRISPRVARVIKRLAGIIKSHAESGQWRLPTIKQLASEQKVSPLTLSKAFSVLQQKGMVILSQRAGIRINQHAINSAFDLLINSEPANRPHKNKSKPRLTELLLHDLFIGEFSYADKLPAIKELSARYGTCAATVRKALANLEGEKLISRYCRGYQVCRPGCAQARHRLVVIAKTDSIQLLSQSTPRSTEFWHQLENECRIRNAAIEISAFGNIRQLLANSGKSVKAGKQQPPAVRGFIVLAQGATFGELQETLALLKETFVPTAVLDETGDTTIPSLSMATTRMRLFVMSLSDLPGKIVGNYLLQHGHKQIAYVGGFIKDSWSYNRYLGLVSACRFAGVPDGVVLSGENWQEEYRRFFEAVPGTQPYMNALPLVSRLCSLVGPAPKTEMRETYLAGILPFLWPKKLEALAQPLFEKTLGLKGPTAWVVESDFLARMALHYLRAKKIKIPNSISVVGFDNTIEALGDGLTSYDFNVAGLVRAIMAHLFTPRLSLLNTRNQPFELEGVVMERGSSGQQQTRGSPGFDNQHVR
jgi:DNA-binding LacI/PurR family transcriptional regulator/DNA-binding transcriptional regulator YhcF (GntR family)